MVSVAQSGGEAVDKHVTFAFDAAGEPTTVSRVASAAAVVSAYTFDGAGRLATLTHSGAAGAIDSYAFTWDADGRLVGLTSTDGTATFAYDAAGQLTDAHYSYQPDESFGYDANGNRIVAGAVLPAADRVLEDGTYTYAYDADGNRVSRTNKATGTVDAYAYDQRDRLVGITTRDAGGVLLASETYRYDDFGWKILRVVDADGDGPAPARTEQFVYDRNNVAMILSSTANQLFLDGAGIDNVLAEQDGSQLRWLLPDHQGTVHDVVAVDGTILDHIRYGSFGNVTGDTDASAAPRYGYTGRELDRVSGMMDYRARWYDPRLGRFLTRDPLGFAAGDPNLYRYVHNDPFDAVDPTGRLATYTATGACDDPLRGLAIFRTAARAGGAAAGLAGGAVTGFFSLGAKLAAGKPVTAWDVVPVALAVPAAVLHIQSVRDAWAMKPAARNVGSSIELGPAGRPRGGQSGSGSAGEPSGLGGEEFELGPAGRPGAPGSPPARPWASLLTSPARRWSSAPRVALRAPPSPPSRGRLSRRISPATSWSSAPRDAGPRRRFPRL